MIGVGNGVRVYLACGVTYGYAQGHIGAGGTCTGQAASGPDIGRSLRLSRSPWGQDQDSDMGRSGVLPLFCLYYKVLETGRFPWPSPADGVARLTAAQMAMLWEGIDWRRPSWSAPPSRVA